MNRRDVLRMMLASAGVGGTTARTLLADKKRLELPDATPQKLPNWRGFNLPVAYRGRRRELFDERDFADVADLGFNFLRLALNYHDWTDPEDPKHLKEAVLKQIDRAVEHGKQHGIHLLLDFHIAPGFGQITPPERTNLWTEAEPAELCAYQWSVFAERYKGVPNSRLSFNLFNEPDDKVKPENLRKVTEQLVRAIRAKDPDRLIIVDGRNWARTPITELLGLNVAADIHSYDPMPVTHYKASWANWDKSWPDPTWPLKERNGKIVDRETIRRTLIVPWQELGKKGVGMFVGEWGVHQHTPHEVALAWMRDMLGLFKEAGWGWALWNFVGSFGVCNSGRVDVNYETWHGRKLDRAMVELLQAF
jgi:endoglucanase